MKGGSKMEVTLWLCHNSKCSQCSRGARLYRVWQRRWRMLPTSLCFLLNYCYYYYNYYYIFCVYFTRLVRLFLILRCYHSFSVIKTQIHTHRDTSKETVFYAPPSDEHTYALWKTKVFIIVIIIFILIFLLLHIYCC